MAIPDALPTERRLIITLEREIETRKEQLRTPFRLESDRRLVERALDRAKEKLAQLKGK